jgi:hypothetical protein
MIGVFKKIGEFIKKIQRSDDQTKKKWLVIFSGTGMLIIIVLWVAYLQITLPQTTATPESTSTEASAPANAGADNGNSFFETLGRGWNNIWSGINNGMNSIGNNFSDGWLKFKDEMNRTNEINLEKP